MNGNDAVDSARDDVAPETSYSTADASVATHAAPRAPRCVNCGALRTGPYCAQCGQREQLGRHTLRGMAAAFLGRVLDLDRGFLHTVHGLTVRPGTAVRDYLAGRTVPYTNPVAYLLIGLTAFAVSVSVLGGTTGGDADRALNALSVPLIAAVSRLLLWRTRLNYAEHLVLWLYLIGHVALIVAVLQAVLSLAVPATPGTIAAGIVMLVLGGIPFTYCGWACSRVFPSRPWRAAAGGLVALAVGVALWLVALVVIVRVVRS